MPSAFLIISVGSRWPYISGSLFSSLQICPGLSGCHCWACVQTHPHPRVQADCLLPVCCCERGLTDQWYHWVFAETQQDWCPRWNNSVYQGKAVFLALEIHLFLMNSFPAASAYLIYYFSKQSSFFTVLFFCHCFKRTLFFSVSLHSILLHTYYFHNTSSVRFIF